MSWIHKGYRWIALTDGREVMQHRDIMEQHLGRKLGYDECVHHKDGNKLNNELENLEIIDRATHTSLHREHRKPCSNCGKDDPHQSRGLCAGCRNKHEYVNNESYRNRVLTYSKNYKPSSWKTRQARLNTWLKENF